MNTADHDRPDAATTGGSDTRRHLSSWSTVLRSFGQLSAAEIAARLLGFVALVVLTRRLGPGPFGIVALGVALVLWLKQVVDAGTEMLNIREISRRPDRFTEIAGPVLSLRLAISALAAAVFCGAVLATTHSNERTSLLLFALALPAVALNLRFMVLGLRAARAVALGNVVSQILLATLIIAFVHGPDDIFVPPLAVAGSELVYGVLIAALVARRYGLALPRIDVGAWRRMLRSGFPLMVNQLTNGVIQSFDLFLIAAILGTASAGVYGAAYRPLVFLTTLMALLGGSFLASYSAAERSQGNELAYRLTRLGLFLSVPLAVALSAGAGFFMTTAFGHAYGAGATPLAILAWLIPLVIVNTVYVTVLIAHDRQALMMRNNIIGAVLNVAANLVVVPIAGIDGAAAVTLASSALVTYLNHRNSVRLGLAPRMGELFVRALSGSRAQAESPTT